MKTKKPEPIEEKRRTETEKYRGMVLARYNLDEIINSFTFTVLVDKLIEAARAGK